MAPQVEPGPPGEVSEPATKERRHSVRAVADRCPLLQRVRACLVAFRRVVLRCNARDDEVAVRPSASRY